MQLALAATPHPTYRTPAISSRPEWCRLHRMVRAIPEIPPGLHRHYPRYRRCRCLGHLFDRHQRTISHFDSRKLSGTGKSEDFVSPISHPDPLGANTDTGDIESFGVNRSYHVRRRKAGDRMLRTHPPEDDSDVDAIHVRSFPYDALQPTEPVPQ